MRVLFISTGDAKYGAPKSMLKLIELLSTKYDCDCILLTKTHNRQNEWCDAHNIENYSFFYRDIMAGDSYDIPLLNFAKHCVKYVLYWFGSFTQNYWISHLPIDFSCIDVIHTNTNRVDLGSKIAHKFGIPHIWHLREMDEGKKNMHYYVHDWATYMNKGATAFVAITNAVKISWASHGLDAAKIQVIYNGIDSKTILAKTGRLFASDAKKVKIISAGRIENGKGQEDIIKAVCELPRELQPYFQIDFYGEAYWDYKKYLDGIANKSHCTATINYMGYCDDLGKKLQEYDIGITCSRAEAFGRTTVEYMLAGLLTIAADSGAGPELIRHGVDGILYRPGDSQYLKLTLLQALDPPAEFYQMAQNGQQRAQALFSAEANADAVYHLYQTMLQEKKG